jgi:hypothetical protein
MDMGPFADDDRSEDRIVDDESTARLYDIKFVRAMKRWAWTGGGLSVTELVSWFGHHPVVQSAAHIVSLPLACLLAIDLGATAGVKAYRAIRKRIIIIDLSQNGGAGRPGQSYPRSPEDRPYTRP